MRESLERGIDERKILETSLPQEKPLTQITQREKQHSGSIPRWMRHFFSEDTSPDNHPVINLQQRATWVGVALILQALNEVNEMVSGYYQGSIPLLKTWSGAISFPLMLGSFVALWMAFRRTTLKQRLGRTRGTSLLHPAHPHLWQRIILIGVLLTSIAGAVVFGQSIVMSFFMPPLYTNDGTSLDTNAAQLLLQGHNPYANSNILDIVREFSIQPDWTTPLREGQFANRLAYPSQASLASALAADQQTGHAPEFESKVSYPALSFLTLVPFIWLGIFNVLSLYLFCYIALVAIAWKVARPELRPWVLLLALANVPMWTSVVGGNLDLLYILPVVLAWLLRERRWWSALLLGLALASKQQAWLFVPFYALMVWRQYNFLEVVRRLLIAGGVALVINLPFILWNPQAWFAGVMAPIMDPMFPSGVGIIGLSSTPLLPFFPSWVYDVLECTAMLVALAWYWRLCKERPEAAMLLAVLPLFLTWRSLPSYFYCAAFPLFILFAAKSFPAKSKRASLLQRPVPLPFDYERAPIYDIPIPVGAGTAFQGIYYLRNWLIARVRPQESAG